MKNFLQFKHGQRSSSDFLKKMMILSLLMTLFGFVQNVSSQTTLAVGDLSVIGFNSNAPDNFAFVTWVPIANNTYIKFTDGGFNGSSASTAASNARGSENFVIWRNNTGSTIAAGTVVSIEGLTTSLGACTGGSTNGLDGISSSGDQLFAYQSVATSGATPNYSGTGASATFTGTMLFGLNYASAWLTTGTASSNTSYLPSDLNVTNGNIALATASTTRGQFTGLRNNQTSLAAYKAIVNNPANWTTATSTGTITLNTTAFTLAALPSVTLSVSATTGTEAGTTAITVRATASAAVSSNQTVALGISGTNITTGDYSLTNTTITIVNGQTTGTVTFTVIDDSLFEGTETATLTISNPSAGLTLGTTLTQSVTITDNDAAPLTIDLSTYIRVGRYDLPEPTRSAHPANNLLAQEASAVTYDWDTDSLFITGDGSTAIVQVSKTGVLINSMTMAQGSSPQGTDFYDTEGITYIGNGQFVMSEERDRQLVLFTYAAGTTLTRANTQTIKIGTFVPNTGTEGLSYDPLTGGYIVLKEIDPIGIFQTNVNFPAGTASNGSATTENSVNLFNPALLNVSDVADVFALSNLPALNGQPLANNLLVLSQEAAKVINVDRNGVIANSLTIVSDAGNPLNVASQQHEGLTMDRNGILYIVSENGGGDIDHPQLWVYAPSTAQNQAPTAVALTNTTPSILENTSTTNAIKVADILVTDDGLGTNNFTVSGTDAAFFEVTGTGLYIKAATVLDYETKTSYNVTVSVDDTTIGATPDAIVNFVLSVIDIAVETPQIASVTISEVAAWGSGNSPVGADWFEVTNNATTTLDITGWKVDDSSNSFAAAIALTGITSIAPGESVIFMEATASNPAATIIPAFKTLWFGANPPAGLQIGTYQGSGIGLSTGGDALNLYNGSGVLQANVVFGTSPTTLYKTFNNAAGLNNATITVLSEIGVNDAFAAVNDSSEIGSPGYIGRLFISEIAPWGSGNSPVAADWFEVTNTKAVAVDITGWKVDDNSQSPIAAVPLSGITSINPGESVIFIETNDLAGKTAAFLNNWFGTNPSSGLRIGNYTGSGVGLGSGGDQVNLYNSSSVLQTSVLFGTSPTTTFATFDNKAGLNSLITQVTQLSVVRINGAFIAANSTSEIGSPGTIITTPCPTITATATPASSKICTGSTTTVSVNATGGTLPYVVTGSPLTVGGGTFNYTITDAKGCTATASTTVAVQALPNAGTDATLTICAGSTVTLSQLNTAITGENLGGIWSPSFAGAGTYTYTVAATSPCTVADTSTVIVTEQAAPNAGTDGVYTICSGTTITLAQLQAAITGEDVGGTWSPAFAGAGTYTYTVAATSPCTSTDTSLVIVSAVSCAATQLSNCGNVATLSSVNTRIFAANTITTAQTYRYRVAVATAPSTYFYATTTYPSFRLTDVIGLAPAYGTTYNVEIQNEFLISGNTVTSAYGPLCTITTQAATNISVPTNQCNQILAAINSKIYVNGVAGATMYTYRIAKATAPNTYSYIDSPYSNFRLTNTPTSGTVAIEHNTIYLVAVSVTTANGASNFNNECNITTPVGPITTIQASQCGDDDNPYIVGTSSTKIYATNFVSGATYTFKLEQYNGATLVDTNYATSPINYFNTNMFTGENSLLPNTNYHVSVTINYYGEGTYDHDCVIKTPAALKQEEMPSDFKAVAYPNPFANNFLIDVKSSNQSSVDLKVYDMIGRLIEQKEVRVSDLETTTIGDRYPSGVYNIVVSQENSIQTVRVVKR